MGCSGMNDIKSEWVWLQALVVSYEKSTETQLSLLEYREEFDRLLSADVVLNDDDATKENVIDRVTKGSASLVHFLVHGTAGGKIGQRFGEERRGEIKGAAMIEFAILCSLNVCMLLVLENRKRERMNSSIRG